MYATVDRFEGDYAVLELENRDMFQVPRHEVGLAREGDVLCIEKTAQGIKYIIDPEETAKRKKRINSLMNKLFHD